MRLWVRSLASLRALRIRRCRELVNKGQRRSSDLPCLWLQCKPAATAPIWSLAWEPPCAAGADLKRQRDQKKKKKKSCSKHPSSLSVATNPSRWWRNECFPLNLRIRGKCSVLSFLFIFELEALASLIRGDKETKACNCKWRRKCPCVVDNPIIYRDNHRVQDIWSLVFKNGANA